MHGHRGVADRLSRDLAGESAPAELERLLSDLDCARFHLLGKGYQASVYSCESPNGTLVVKKAHDSLLLGKAGLLAIKREQRVYEKLRHIEGVPRSYGLIDGQYLVLQHVEGKSLRDAESSLSDRTRFYDDLRATIEAIHRAGVAHGDLKRKDNILVGPEERPYVIDFGIARLEEDGTSWWSRWLYDWFKQSDYNAWVKLKYRRRFGDLSPADREIYRPLLLERIARAIRIPAERLTLRRLRKRLRQRRQNGT
jgi:predicted Ser/Thr protein kinase